mgnify:FL=1
MKKKIWHISDTHSYHRLLNIPKDIDIVAHSGDFTNYYDRYKNITEAIDFIHWFGNLDIKHKVLIAGNHDASAFYKESDLMYWIEYYNIHYLENETVEIEGLKIHGSPNTPTFGNWYFMKSRDKLFKHWNESIPLDTDVLIVHGPPKGVLDLSYSREGKLEYCGCKSLKTLCLEKLNLKACLFGHIHNNEDIINAGVLKLSQKDTIFSNGSVVTDGRFGKLSSNGNIIEINHE